MSERYLKLIKSLIANNLKVLFEENNLIAEEQKGGRRNPLGCKDSLRIPHRSINPLKLLLTS